MNDIDTLLLRSFLTLERTKSFSRTAQIMGRTQSAISEQMRRLEALMNVSLLVRTTRSVRLTPQGERFRQHAEKVLAANDALFAAFRSDAIRGDVFFGAPEDFATAHLPRILGAFARTYEAVTLHVSCDLTLRLVQDFERKTYEMVIVKQDPGQPVAGARRLMLERLGWAGAKGENRSIEEIGATYASLGKSFPLVSAPAPCVYRRRATEALERMGLGWTTVYSSPSLAGAIAAVKAGLGFMVVPLTLADDALSKLNVETSAGSLPDAEICLLAAERLTPQANALRDYITESFLPYSAAIAVAKPLPEAW